MLLQGRYLVIKPLSRGSFGQTFEVEDIDSGGENSRKVVKVLLIDSEKAISLFQREAQVLQKLNHPGIPKVAPDGYFTWQFPQRQALSHCIVMEKIEGLNLRQWLEAQNNQSLTSEQGITWIKQLIQILDILHQQNFLHRDIKPSNIMLRPNGQLVLIDFGAVKEAAETQLHNSQSGDGTLIISPGYTSPEQAIGSPGRRSDFYALGRTFVHLITGKHPLQFENDQTHQFNWRSSAPHISSQFADLIDSLIAPSYQDRPLDARKILHRLKQIEYPFRDRLLKGGLGLGAILFCILVVKWFTPKTCPIKIGDNLSCGEEILFPIQAPPEKAKAAQEIARNNYKNAILLLEKARKIKPTDPETLIYLNNARLAKQSVYTIAISIPIDKNPFSAKEMLWGVAIAQDEINRSQKINGKGIRVEIANDSNKVEQAKTIANKLRKQVDLLTVIGHYASEITLSTLNIYQGSNLVLISSTSTSETLGNHSYFFRTVPSTRIEAKTLADYLIKQSQKTQVAIFYNPQSNYSKSIHDQFQSSYNSQGGKIVAKFDLSDPEFNEIDAINQAKSKGDTALVLFPDGRTNEFVFNNTLKVIQANQCRYPMVGGNALYTSELLKLTVANCLVVSIPWHELNNSNLKFSQLARNLGAQEVTWRTALSYDAMYVGITALSKHAKPNRYLMQKTLKKPSFEVTGATGKITFAPNGDRNETISQLVILVENKCPPFNYLFVPLNSPAAKSGSGNCYTQTNK